VRLAFLVPDPGFGEEWRWAFDAEAEALVSVGIDVDPVAWTDQREFAGYDLVLPLVAWGYFERPGEWFALLDRFERDQAPVANAPSVLRWSSDKTYLADLARHGVPTVPTIAVGALRPDHIDEARERFGRESLIVKPPISAGAFHTYRLGPRDAAPESRLGMPAIIQPFVEAIATGGEYSLMLFDGAFSHAVVKHPKAGDFRVQPHLGGTTSPCEPPEGALDLAQAALAVAPAPTSYARVDIIRDDEGILRIMELELVEPALFLDLAPDRGTAFTRSILSAAERAREKPLADR